MKMTITIGMVILVALLVVSGNAGDQPKTQEVATQTGIASSNALATLTAVLKQVPQGDTILDIRFVNPSHIQVRVCAQDPSQGCTQNYEQKDGKWRLGIIAHWHSEQALRR